MKKITVLLLVISLLCSSFSVTFAVDYREQALQLLAEKLQVSPETINLDGSLVELSLTGERLWAGKYFIGEASSERPITDDVVDDPDRAVSHDPSEGAVYLHVKTGELLTHEETQLYFDEEEKLRQAEIGRLTEQSGKIDPYFYQKIINADSGELFETIIWVTYVETASMKSAIEKIMQDYPEFDGGWFLGDPARDLDFRSESPETLAPDSAEILPYPGPDSELIPKEDIFIEDPAMIDDTDWLRYEEMMNRLAQVRTQGYATSQAALEKTLVEMGVTYEMLEGNAAVRCELTTEQLMSLKEAEHIDSINEDIIFLAMDGMERNASVLDNAAGNSAPNANPWVQAAILLLMAGGGAYYIVQRKKKGATETS